ncbi:MAG TPA: CHAT domain-containing protein [Kofleriaceae bacterium]|nr:CHAT domain-containing protein [Kofleriaceae bacterium]
MASIVTGALAGLGYWRVMHPPRSPCERAVAAGDSHRGFVTCLASYASTRDDVDLVWAARAQLYLDRPARAAQLARALLGRSRYGDAHQILSYVALRERLDTAARAHAAIAWIAHALAADEQGLARDAVSMSQAARQAGDYPAALASAQEALRRQRGLHDAHNEMRAEVALIDVLRVLGDTGAADTAIGEAFKRATEPCDRAWLALRKGQCQIDRGQGGVAIDDLEQAARLNRQCDCDAIALQVAANEASLLRRSDPGRAAELLDEVVRIGGEDLEEQLMRGYLAADRGDLDAADRHFRRAEALPPPDADWAWEVERARAELAEQRGGLLGDLLAEYHYRRAIARIAAVRATVRARSAYVVSSHRGPYDGLIALLARQRRWRDALAVIVDLDASDMLRATADAGSAHRPDGLDADDVDPSAAAAPAFAVDDVLAAWRARELVIAIAPSPRQVGAGKERAYRLRIAGGEVTGEDIGEASAARRWALQLYGDPGRRDAAQALGRMIVPPGTSSATLDVLAIGSLGKVPLVALRDDGGSLIIGRRPLERVLALAATGPESEGAGPPVVLADPLGDLPHAAMEGVMVARAMGPGVQLSGASTPRAAIRARLWEARGAGLLHVAAHVAQGTRWRALRLVDGQVEPAEILEQRLAPRVAVLAACGSAAAMDEEGWGSIASALLASGTAVVIATDRTVRDDVSLAVMTALYAQRDWQADPARALARVLLALDLRSPSTTEGAAQPRDWAAFSVLARPPVVAPRTPRDGAR